MQNINIAYSARTYSKTLSNEPSDLHESQSQHSEKTRYIANVAACLLGFICKRLVVMSRKAGRLVILSMYPASDFSVYIIPQQLPGDRGILNVTFAFADELANQRLYCLHQARPRTYSFIYALRLLPSIRAV